MSHLDAIETASLSVWMFNLSDLFRNFFLCTCFYNEIECVRVRWNRVCNDRPMNHWRWSVHHTSLTKAPTFSSNCILILLISCSMAFPSANFALAFFKSINVSTRRRCTTFDGQGAILVSEVFFHTDLCRFWNMWFCCSIEWTKYNIQWDEKLYLKNFMVNHYELVVKRPVEKENDIVQ